MRNPFLLSFGTAILAGCTVGPNYAGPPPAAPTASNAPGFLRVGETPVTADAPAAHWWEGLNDPALNALITKALSASPNTQIAQARLRQARAALRLERANGAPNANASALYAHAHLPGVDLGEGSEEADGASNGGSNDLNLYNLGFDASWEIDLFGGQRRATEAARATAEAAEANLADAQVTLSADVANAYINLRERQQRIALDQTSVAMQQQILELTRQRLDRGAASELDVAQLEGEISGTLAQLSPIKAEREAFLNALAVLTGEEPGALDASLADNASIPLPPPAIAIGNPAALLQRRPDIRAAERKLAAETAKVGQAEAARFPRLSFMGLIGIGGTKLSDLGTLDDFAAIAAPRLSWNILDFGRNRARIEQSEAARDEAEARYRGAVLAALQDAEDSLGRFRYQRINVAALARTKKTADQAVNLMTQRYSAGTITLIALLNAKRRQISAEQNLLSAQSALTGDFVSIQKALGLGWSDG